MEFEKNYDTLRRCEIGIADTALLGEERCLGIKTPDDGGQTLVTVKGNLVEGQSAQLLQWIGSQEFGTDLMPGIEPFPLL